MIKRRKCQFHKLSNPSANCTIKMSVLDSGLCRIELTINSFKNQKSINLINLFNYYLFLILLFYKMIVDNYKYCYDKVIILKHF